jgi:uncharacterized protein YciI
MTITAITHCYPDDVARRDRVLPEHRDWLRGLADQGVLLMSGPYGPDEPLCAVLLFRPNKAQVRVLIEKAPFAAAGGVIAKTEIAVWEPLIGSALAAIGK